MSPHEILIIMIPQWIAVRWVIVLGWWFCMRRRRRWIIVRMRVRWNWRQIRRWKSMSKIVKVLMWSWWDLMRGISIWVDVRSLILVCWRPRWLNMMIMMIEI